MRTPIKYYGGKTRMLPHLLPMIPAHRIYVEAFAGGAALFWAKEPSAIEVLNDINGNVANFYRVVKLKFKELRQLVESTLHCEGTFNECKHIYNNPESFSDVKRAWAFFVGANMSYGAEVAGSFQWVKNKTDNWHPDVAISNRREQFQMYAGRLDKVCIHDRPAHILIKQRDSSDTFFYLDPPYVGARQGHYKGYTQDHFNVLLETIATIKGKFLMSSYQNEDLNDFVEKYNWRQQEFSKRLGVAGDNQRKIEVLTYNF